MPRRPLALPALLIPALLLGCAHHHSAGRSVDEVGRAIEQRLDALAEGQVITHEALEGLIALGQRQGTGEITLFFGPGEARLDGSQQARLVRFLDTLQREAHGREIRLVCVGSAGSRGPLDWNRRLSERRALAARSVIDHYLVNAPHSYLDLYGTGSTQSPPDVGLKVSRRYRSVRVIAVYDEGQLPELPGR